MPERIRSIDPLEVDILLLLGHIPLATETPAAHFSQEILDLVRARSHFGLPMLGIGLGAQLIACALGGSIQPMSRPEIAFAAVELSDAGRRSCLAPLRLGTPVLHWHRDEILLPDTMQRLAYTAADRVQAFRRGPQILGLQFHLEADMDYLNARLQHLSHSPASAGVDPLLLRMQASESMQRLRHACHAVMTRWLDEMEGNEFEPQANGSTPWQ
ncbi:MAG TPA: glutamine amidotransferase [Stenotrophomonas sp.]|nr:glutamine amidotransferase [Stenotrophomonas sp.]